MPETIYTFSELISFSLFEFSNHNHRIKCKTRSDVLVSLLLTVNIFYLLILFFAKFEHVNDGGIPYCLNLNLSMCFRVGLGALSHLR